MSFFIADQVRSGTTIAAHCAKVRDIIRTVTGLRDPRFPLGLPGRPVGCKVLCHPVCSEEEEIEAVLEFVKVSCQNIDMPVGEL